MTYGPIISTGEVARKNLAQLEEFVRTKRMLPAVRRLLRIYGTNVTVTRRRQSTQGDAAAQLALDVYGSMSGFSGDVANPKNEEPTGPNVVFPAKILINAQTYRFADNAFANDFERLYSWSEDPILPLDVVSFDRVADGLHYTFQINSLEVFGQTETILHRFLLSPTVENLTMETEVTP
jgi:hypothetical protein